LLNGSERNSELFFRPRNGSERNSERLRSAKWTEIRRNKTLIFCLFRVSLKKLISRHNVQTETFTRRNTNVKFTFRILEKIHDTDLKPSEN
jgi:hypothetical protein